MNLAAEEKIDELFLLAAPPAIGFVFANAVLTKARIRVPDLEIQTITKASAWLSSTARWGCGYRCDGTASGLTVGRFHTLDPYMASAKGVSDPTTPGSWNRYAYVLGDPVNNRDSRGTDLEECDEDCGDGIGDLEGGGVFQVNPCIVMVWGVPSYVCGYSYSSGPLSGVFAGSGPGSSSYRAALQAAQTARATEATLKDTPLCDRTLAAVGISFQQLQSGVASEVFQDGSTANNVTMASLFLNSSPANYQNAVNQYGNTTVQQYLSSAAGGGSSAVACAGCNTVYLNYLQFGGSLNVTNEAILMHEALHNITGDTDTQLQSVFQKAGFNAVPGASSNNLPALMLSNCVF
jgi:hypothetical protein